MKSSKTTRFGFLTALILLGGGAAPQALAGVYDDVAYWFRGVNNNSAPTIPQLEDWDECPNALYLNLNGGHGRIGDTKDGDVSGDRWVPVTGQRKDVCANEVMDVPMPYARRIQKSRSPVHFKQPTYRNPGDETLYGTQNFIGLTNPFSFENTNAYTAVFRIMHEGYISPTNQRAGFANVGYGWSASTGFYAELCGDPDNEYLNVRLGQTAVGDFTACQRKASTRLSTNKWIDVAFTLDPKVGFTVYTCPEGGELCTQFAGWKPAWSKSSPKYLRLGTGDSDKANSQTNVAVATTSGYYAKFRGWFDQVATWPRALTKDEIREAFGSGFKPGDALRFGVANGLSCEFAGYDRATKKDKSATSADLSTDWRFFPPAFNAATNSATVTFGAMRAADYRRPLRFVLKATPDSPAGARMSATLNGKALLSDSPVAPGASVTVPVAYADVGEAENTLVLTRTDASEGDLMVDAFSIEAAESSEPAAGGLGKVADDVWSGAFAWWQGVEDVNANGFFTSGDRFRNRLLASDAFDSDSSHSWNVDGNYSVVKIASTDVTCPATGATLPGESCLYFDPRIYKSANGETNFHDRADIYHSVFTVTNSASYAWTVRFKVMEFVEGQTRAYVAGCGYGWSADTGSGLILLKDDKGDDNLSLYFALGLGSYTSNYPQTLDERDHIGVGKWIDFGLSCSNGVMRFYYAVEGGSGVVELPNTYSSASWKVAKSSICCLGLISTTGKSGATDSVPQSKMYVHRFAVWPHALTKDEMTAALSFPRPNIAQFGIANGSDSEFAGMSPTSVYGATDAKVGEFASLLPSAILPGSPFAVECTVEDGQAASNQVVRLRALPGFDPAARLRVTFDGTTVTNFADHVAVSSFAPDANGVYEVGVRRELIGAPGAHTLRLYAEGGEISIDSLTFGNFGRRIFLPSGKGAVLIVR